MKKLLEQFTRERLEALIDDEDCRATVAEQEVLAGIALAVMDGKYPEIPDGWKLVPVEPTEDMVVEGFESKPCKLFSEPAEWASFDEMSGCQQAAHTARLCWAAMLAAAPTPGGGDA